MPLIKYKDISLSAKRLIVVNQANEIIAEYSAQGFDLTLRQLYYQFVSRDLIANTQKEYKRLGDIINDARLAGLIDWNHITDRTRNIRSLSHWDSPADIMASCAASFRIDKWAEQDHRIEVWIEKDALIGVIEGVCNELDVPYFSCRGYTSQSEMWAASQRLLSHKDNGQDPVILHLGDHDPSGLDMSRDIQDRLELFIGDSIQFDRLALNLPQIDEYQPPPNPAKITDSRFEGYQQKYGSESWELDALDPKVISELIRDAISHYRRDATWRISAAREKEMRAHLQAASDRWDGVVEFLGNGKGGKKK